MKRETGNVKREAVGARKDAKGAKGAQPDYDVPYGQQWRDEMMSKPKDLLITLLATAGKELDKNFKAACAAERAAAAAPKRGVAERMVRVRHIASGRYLVVTESCRVYSRDDPAPEYKLTWGPQSVASALIESTARAVAAAWISMADDSSVEIEEVEA